MTPALAPGSPRPSILVSPAGTLPLLLLLAAAATAWLFFPAAALRGQTPGTGATASGRGAAVAPLEEKAGFDVILTETGANKIGVIKQVREAVPGLGLAETKTLVESAPKPIKRGVTIAEAQAIKRKVEGAGAKVTIQSEGAKRTIHSAATSLSEKANYEVILIEAGPNKISVIKEVRDAVPGMGLAQAKALVESAPKSIKAGVTKLEAETIKGRVEAVGAKVEIRLPVP